MGKKKKKKSDEKIVLIVGDEPVVLKMIASLLEVEGYKVLKAGNSKQACKVSDANRVDIAVMDMMIPKRLGIAIAWELRTRGHEFPMIMLSAFLDQWDKEVFQDCKIDKWIAKPVKPKKLFEAMEELLKGK